MPPSERGFFIEIIIMELLSDRGNLHNLTAVSFIRNGFSTRIKNIVSCQRLASNVDVYWEASEQFGYMGLSYYFPELKETKTYKNKLYRYGWWRLATLPGEVEEGFTNKDDLFEHCKRQFHPENYKIEDHYGFNPRGKGIDFEFHRTPNTLKTEYGELFSNLKIAQHILDKVDEFSTEHFDDNTISVHMRTWVDCHWRRPTVFSFESYIEAMMQHQGSKFFISTDECGVIPKLKEIFGDENIITYPNSTERYVGFFVDLLLLSKNDKIIGSLLSTFTELAWWFSGTKAEIEIPYPKKIIQYQDPQFKI